MKPILLLHGATGAKDQLEPLAKELSSLGYEIYSFSFSGHGQTPYGTEFSIKHFSFELEQFIKQNHLLSPDVFGYSMGGYVALYLASQQPDRLGKIITLGTKFEWSPEIAAKEAKMLDAKTISEKVPKFAAALETRHGKDWQLLLQRTAEMMKDLGKDNLLNPTTFSKIRNKVLIGLADGDTMVTVEETDNAASKIVGASRYTMQNTKHPIESVGLNELLQIIINFIK